MEYIGNPVSEGIALGKAMLYRSFAPKIEKTYIEADAVNDNIDAYYKAVLQAKSELNKIYSALQKTDPENAELIAAHVELLLDEEIDKMVRSEISNNLRSCDWAIFITFNHYATIFSELDDPILQQRAIDMQDLCNRLLRCRLGIREQNLSHLEKPVVIVARELFPSDTATLDRKNVLAIVTELGGATSHTSILARSYEIPALVGVQNVIDVIPDNTTVIVDALSGKLFVSPNESLTKKYLERREKYQKEIADIRKHLYDKPLTYDKEYIDLMVNIESVEEHHLQGAQYSDGVGLFRTEFLYMNRPDLPSEEEQVAAYKKVLEAYGEKPVIVRTLDIGGDKQLDSISLPVEENPMLGNRAIRLCFSHPDLFLTQLRACLRASVFGNLWVMFPMLNSVDDIYRAMNMVNQAKKMLDQDGLGYSDTIRWGGMIEIPSAAIMADHFAEELDFASIGTNDLGQYLMAVDRMDQNVSEYTQAYHPALFRLIYHVSKAFNNKGKPLSICGELGGDRLIIPLLVGLGIRKLSMNSAFIARAKKTIADITILKSEQIASEVLKMPTALAIEEYLNKFTYMD